MKRMHHTRLAVVGVLLLGLAGCDSPTPTQPGRTLASVVVAGAPPSVGGSKQFVATAVWTDGAKEDVTTLAAWQSANTAIFTVNAAGLVTGVTVGAADVRATYQSVTGTTSVSVTAMPCSFTVSPLNVTLPYSGGSATLNMTATSGCEWTARTDHPFMSIVSGTSGTGSGPISVTMQPNSELGRQGSVITTGPFVVLFNQTQAPCVISVTPVPQSLPTAGGTVVLNIVAPAGCTWTASTSVASVTFPGRRTGVGSDEIVVSIRKNGTGAIRMNQVNVEERSATILQSTPSGSYFIHTSDLADGIGHGLDEAIEFPPHPVTASAASTSEAHFVIPIPGSTSVWDLLLRAPTGQPLVPGTYLNAQAGAGASPSLPYVNLTMPTWVFGNCGPSGQFTVHEIVYGPGPTIVRFWATFEQRCPTSSSSRLRGEISFGR